MTLEVHNLPDLSRETMRIISLCPGGHLAFAILNNCYAQRRDLLPGLANVKLELFGLVAFVFLERVGVREDQRTQR